MPMSPQLTNAQEYYLQVSCGDLDQNRTDRNVITLLSKVWILLHLLSQNPIIGCIVVDTFIARVRALVFAYKVQLEILKQRNHLRDVVEKWDDNNKMEIKT